MTTALLIIDVQHLLCHGKYACFEADRVIARINGISTRARAAGAPVIVVQHESTGGSMDHGSEAWQLAHGLHTAGTDVFLRKTTPDAFHATDLKAILDRHGVNRLIICGMQSEYCVDTTVRRALALGYPVTLASDAHSTLDNGALSASQISAHHNATLAGITSFGVRATVAPAASVLA